MFDFFSLGRLSSVARDTRDRQVAARTIDDWFYHHPTMMARHMARFFVDQSRFFARRSDSAQLSLAHEASQNAAMPNDGCCGDDVSPGDIALCNNHRRPPHIRHVSSDVRSNYKVIVDSASCRT